MFVVVVPVTVRVSSAPPSTRWLTRPTVLFCPSVLSLQKQAKSATPVEETIPAGNATPA